MFQPTGAFSGFSVDDQARAREFYEGTLGLKVEDSGMGLNLQLPGGVSVFAYPKGEAHRPATFTILNFVVDDIDGAVDDLSSRGVTFERYSDVPGIDEKGIVRGRGQNMDLTSPGSRIHPVTSCPSCRTRSQGIPGGRMKPEIRYAQTGDLSIAYSVMGNGPLDLVMVPGFESHVELGWEYPPVASFLGRLASFSRLIMFDKRGSGLSDRGVEPAIEGYVADAKAVMDACGSDRAAILGVSEGGSTAILFAATYPERTTALIVYGGWARVARADDYPIGFAADRLLESANYVADRWGTGVGLRGWAPSIGDDETAREWWAQFQRLAASPRDVRRGMSAYASMDVRPALPAISAPTLVIHRKGDLMVPVALGRFVADNIEGAQYTEVEGSDHFIFTGNTNIIIGTIQEFLTGAQGSPEPTRRLATVLFTDIVGSTERSAALGDQAWRSLLERHDAMIRRALARYFGREVKTMGDGFLAVFEAPTGAIRCADAIRGGAQGLGLAVRIGIHTGEVELIADDIGGIAVAIARRVADLPGPGEIWVSATVPGVVVGSGIQFREQGSYSLKGIPGSWPVFAVESL